jgi:hypothetical protein
VATDYGSYFAGLMNQGIISKDNVIPGSAAYGEDGNQWYKGTDNNLYSPVWYQNQTLNDSGTSFGDPYIGYIEQTPYSAIQPGTFKSVPGATSNLLDPTSGSQVGTAQANFDKIDGGEWAAIALLSAISGGAAYAGLGAGAAAGAGGAGGAGAGVGGIVDGTAAGYAGLDAAGASTLGGGASVGGGSALGGLGAAGAAFNPAVDSQLANSQLGITGSQAAADAGTSAIPSVTVNGAPSSMWSSLFPNTGTDTLSSPWEKIGQSMLKKAGTSLLNKGISGLAGGGGSPGGLSLSLPQSTGPSTSVSPAPGYYSIASTPKNPYTLGLMRGSNGN